MLQHWPLLLVAVALGLAIVQHFLERRRPIPGIPFNSRSRRRVLGDLAAMRVYRKAHPDCSARDYLYAQCVENNTPIMQFWIQPLGRPIVVVCDGPEAEEVLTKKVKGLDRGRSFSDLFRAVSPESQITHFTNNEWKLSRRLLRNIMSDRSLNDIALVKTHHAVLSLVDLWKQKLRLAPGHTFEARRDIFLAITDAIWSMTFGSTEDARACEERSQHLAGLDQVILPPDRSSAVVQFPLSPLPDNYQALDLLMASGAICRYFGCMVHEVALRIVPKLRRANRIIQGSIRRRVEDVKAAVFESSTTAGSNPQLDGHALGLIVRQEVTQASTKGSAPLTPTMSRRICSELSLFLTAGTTTTSDTLGWVLKLLSVDQAFQTRIRHYMYTHMGDSQEVRELSVGAQLATAYNPYLEAFLYETLRFHAISGGPIRTAMDDTEVLGTLIPKGTDVIFQIHGPSFRSRALRQRQTAGKGGMTNDLENTKWNWPDLHEFRPERWLVDKGMSDPEFNPEAAPMLAFGTGPRACFGRKLAQMQMRQMCSLVLWHFELQAVPAPLMDFSVEDDLTINPHNLRLKLKAIRGVDTDGTRKVSLNSGEQYCS